MQEEEQQQRQHSPAPSERSAQRSHELEDIEMTRRAPSSTSSHRAGRLSLGMSGVLDESRDKDGSVSGDVKQSRLGDEDSNFEANGETASLVRHDVCRMCGATVL